MAISVRAEAHRTVDPDYGILGCQLGLDREDSEAAQRAAAVALETLTGGLAALGGVARTAASTGAALTWSVGRINIRRGFRNKAGGPGPSTSAHFANVEVTITVRDLTALGGLTGLLEQTEHLEVGRQTWHVDDDNPVWPDLRAEAIQLAVAKGWDYASAVGSSLVSLDHVADVGLLDGAAPQASGRRTAFSASARPAAAPAAPVGPVLEPVPQELSAVIEARFAATAAQIGRQSASDPTTSGPDPKGAASG